jgi:hypothetical protein
MPSGRASPFGQTWVEGLSGDPEFLAEFSDRVSGDGNALSTRVLLS